MLNRSTVVPPSRLHDTHSPTISPCSGADPLFLLPHWRSSKLRLSLGLFLCRWCLLCMFPKPPLVIFQLQLLIDSVQRFILLLLDLRLCHMCCEQKYSGVLFRFLLGKLSGHLHIIQHILDTGLYTRQRPPLESFPALSLGLQLGLLPGSFSPYEEDSVFE